MTDQTLWRVETKPLPPFLPARLPKVLIDQLKNVLAENKADCVSEECTVYQLWDLIRDFLVDMNK